MKKAEAYKIRNAIVVGSASLDDKTASEAPTLFPKLKTNNALISAGTRINWNGTVKRAAVDLWDTEANNPDNAPSLWEDILFKNGIRIIPETITAGTAFSMGEKGYWKDTLYESTLANNVWNPEQNPSGWKVVEE